MNGEKLLFLLSNTDDNLINEMLKQQDSIITHNKNKKRLVRFLGICAAFGLVIIATILAYSTRKAGVPTVNAEQLIKDTVSEYLDARDVNYSSVTISEGTLSIELLSNGDARCTIKDVKSIQYVYEAVHAKTITELATVKNVNVEIYDTNNTCIYNNTVNDVDSPTNGAELMHEEASNYPPHTTDTEIKECIRELSNEQGFVIKSLELLISEEIEGRRLELVITNSDLSFDSMTQVSALYDNLSNFALATDAITQCSITLEDSDGTCQIYMTGDFQFGNAIAWMSPEIQDAFKAYRFPDMTNN